MSPRASSVGRPKSDQIRFVQERVLENALSLFLDMGFERTSIDAVARKAKASKTTIYRRFPNKESLFTAAIDYGCELIFSATQLPKKITGPMEDRLIIAGKALIDITLRQDSLALMRLLIAEAARLPDLSEKCFAIGFSMCTGCVQNCLEDLILLDGTRLDQDLKNYYSKRFVELALHPICMYAFFGYAESELRERALNDVIDVAHLLASGPKPPSVL